MHVAAGAKRTSSFSESQQQLPRTRKWIHFLRHCQIPHGGASCTPTCCDFTHSSASATLYARAGHASTDLCYTRKVRHQLGCESFTLHCGWSLLISYRSYKCSN